MKISGYIVVPAVNSNGIFLRMMMILIMMMMMMIIMMMIMKNLQDQMSQNDEFRL